MISYVDYRVLLCLIPTLLCLDRLTQLNVIFLVIGSHEEIRDAVWSCGSDRARGPNGFSFRFVKKFWEILKEDICNFVDEFF